MNGTTLTLGPGWCWPLCPMWLWPLIGPRLITWPEYWPVIGWQSPMSGASLGPAWPLSSKVNDFNQFLITDHTLAQPPMGHWAAGTKSPGPLATPGLSISVSGYWMRMPFWRGDQEKLVWPPMCCWLTGARAEGDLAGGTGRDRASNTGQIVSSHGAGSYWNSRLCTTHDEMMRDPSGWRHQIPRTWKAEYDGEAAAKFLDYIDLGIDITPRDYAITNPLICPCLASHKFRCKM